MYVKFIAQTAVAKSSPRDSDRSLKNSGKDRVHGSRTSHSNAATFYLLTPHSEGISNLSTYTEKPSLHHGALKVAESLKSH